MYIEIVIADPHATITIILESFRYNSTTYNMLRLPITPYNINNIYRFSLNFTVIISTTTTMAIAIPN